MCVRGTDLAFPLVQSGWVLWATKFFALHSFQSFSFSPFGEVSRWNVPNLVWWIKKKGLRNSSIADLWADYLLPGNVREFCYLCIWILKRVESENWLHFLTFLRVSFFFLRILSDHSRPSCWVSGINLNLLVANFTLKLYSNKLEGILISFGRY